MYLIYVDEAGDPGPLSSNGSPWFVLSALVVHETCWNSALTDLVRLRRSWRKQHDLPLSSEVHAAEMFNRRKLIDRDLFFRTKMLSEYCHVIAQLEGVAIFNVAVDKLAREARGKPYDHFVDAWTFLLQRIENTIAHANLPSPSNGLSTTPGNKYQPGATNQLERGILLCDETNSVLVTRTMRRMRRFNVVPSKVGLRLPAANQVVRHLVEDPLMKRSIDSLFIQSVDVVSFATYQRVCPSKRGKRYRTDRLFDELAPVLSPYASKTPGHIVHIK